MAEKSDNAKLVLNDFARIQYAFQLLKDRGTDNSASNRPPSSGSNLNPSNIQNEFLEFDTRNLTEDQIKRFAKLKHLVSHRDNEISTYYYIPELTFRYSG